MAGNTVWYCYAGYFTLLYLQRVCSQWTWSGHLARRQPGWRFRHYAITLNPDTTQGQVLGGDKCPVKGVVVSNAAAETLSFVACACSRTVQLLLLLLQPLPDAAAAGQERLGASTDQLPPSHETPTIIRHSERRTTTDKNTRLTKNTRTVFDSWQLPNSQWQEGVQYVKKNSYFVWKNAKILRTSVKLTTFV